MAPARVEIDGRLGEGGGSILRIAAGLSAVTGKPMLVTGIRANRPRKGLAPQHLTGLRSLAKLFNARTSGMEIGSTTVEFDPGAPCLSSMDIDVGTAGSIGLILQTLMIPLPFCGREVALSLRGGTHVPWSPNADYLGHVTIPILERMGYESSFKVLTTGYYPKGGGTARFVARPVDRLRPVNLEKFGTLLGIGGISRTCNLPGHIARRQAESAAEVLSGTCTPRIEVREDRSLSPGTSITLWARTDSGGLIGSSSLGKRGKPAEEVGREAGHEIRSYIEAASPMDAHLLDQVLPYAAMADGESIFRCSDFTMHAATNVHIIKEFLEAEISVEGDVGGPCEVRVRGVGLKGGAECWPKSA